MGVQRSRTYPAAGLLATTILAALVVTLSNQTPALALSGLGNANGQDALATLIRRGKKALLGSYTTAKAFATPPSPIFYGGFRGYNEMAQVGVGSMAARMKLTVPKVVIVSSDTAGGKEYADHTGAAAAKAGGSGKAAITGDLVLTAKLAKGVRAALDKMNLARS